MLHSHYSLFSLFCLAPFLSNLTVHFLVGIILPCEDYPFPNKKQHRIKGSNALMTTTLCILIKMSTRGTVKMNKNQQNFSPSEWLSVAFQCLFLLLCKDNTTKQEKVKECFTLPSSFVLALKRKMCHSQLSLLDMP